MLKPETTRVRGVRLTDDQYAKVQRAAELDDGRVVRSIHAWMRETIMDRVHAVLARGGSA